MARLFLIGTNFKMNQTLAETAAFYQQLSALVQNPPGVHLFVIPPYTSFGAVSEVAGQLPIGSGWVPRMSTGLPTSIGAGWP
jgi:triosephosphate isomerase